jgi:inhibitor of cysteine peptidase
MARMRWLLAPLLLLTPVLSAATEIAAVQLAPGAHAFLTVRRGQSFAVRLKANPSTGYRWQLARGDASIVVLVASRDEPGASSSPPLMGAPGVQVLTFETKGVGETDVVLAYARPWEKGRAPVSTAELSVRVSE